MSGIIQKIGELIPEVEKPKQARLSFNDKLKWTLTILVLYYVLSLIPLYGLDPGSVQTFEFFSTILGASLGSLITLGIGPIVTASIVLQLFVGTGILNIDLTSHEGKAKYQNLQKIFSFVFIIIESTMYVLLGGLRPPQELMGTSAYTYMEIFLIIQIIIGGILILYMDEVVSKWGFGSGISLFILAGVARTLVVRSLNPFPSPRAPDLPIGAIPALFKAISMGEPTTATLLISSLVATLLVFFIVAFAQSIRVEIPLSFGMVRGYGIRWPLRFFYTSNIPVILIASLLASIQLFGKLITGNEYSWLNGVNIVERILTNSLTFTDLVHAVVYVFIMVFGSLIFSIFWVQTAGLDAKSQAKQITASGLQIAGFRRDPRAIERLLNRYIPALTVVGGASVGLLAALADLTGALAGGTAILLAVMIAYNLYEEIAQQHAMDMYPVLRKIIKK